MSNSIKSMCGAALFALAFAVSGTAQAMSPLKINLGLINVDPDSDGSVINGTTSELYADGDTTLGITFDYFFNENFAIELIAALPFEHDISANDVADATTTEAVIGSIKHLPPTLLAQYHFGAERSAFRPFVGLGLNYTIFFSEETLDGSNLELDSSFGLAYQFGANFAVDDTWGIHAVATMIDIDTDASVDGTEISTVEIDPWVVMIGVRFSL